MMKTRILSLILLSTLFACSQQEEPKSFDTSAAKSALDFAVAQYKGMIPTVPDSAMPRTFQEGTFKTTGINGWVSGFYPGTLWYLFEYSGDAELKAEAIERTQLLEPLRFNTRTHDLGFMVFNSYGNAFRVTGDTSYIPVIVDGSASLSTRFNKEAGIIKSWDHKRGDDWSFPVIIDNMMNLEMLSWASQYTGDSSFVNIAFSHADTTMKYHYRDDFSTWHVLDYDTINGGVNGKMTHQGYADESSWARGQIWGLYGYTMMYRETGMKKYLNQANSIANFLLSHPNLPEDKIPYWDFDAPDIPSAYRDASSGAIMSSALLELSQYVGDSLKEVYYQNAEQMLQSLNSPKYRAPLNENGNFILMHSVGHLPGGSEIDVPLSYADYYFVEALLRYLALNNEFQLKKIKK